MNEDHTTRDRDDGPATAQSAEDGVAGGGDVWARAAQQARRDIARAENHSTGREKSTAKTGTF